MAETLNSSYLTPFDFLIRKNGAKWPRFILWVVAWIIDLRAVARSNSLSTLMQGVVGCRESSARHYLASCCDTPKASHQLLLGAPKILERVQRTYCGVGCHYT